jgi:hypothetical protein
LPLSEKLRIEFYFPDSPNPSNSQLINQFENEMAYTFGGCSVIQGMKGLYKSREGSLIQDRVHLLFTDVELKLGTDRPAIDLYIVTLTRIMFEALQEEKVLIAVYPVFHQITS